MFSKFILVNVILLFSIDLVAASVEIIKISGVVKIRRGVDEHWQPVSGVTSLEEVDSILTGESGEVTLRLPDGSLFRLGANAILDIADLRRISEREMFLYLMSKKIDRIGPRQEKTKLRIGNVHVTHGELNTRADGQMAPERTGDKRWAQECNGATALYEQEYVTNAIIKLNKIIRKYPEIRDCGELQYKLGLAFEALKKEGQALGAYQAALDGVDDDCSNEWQELAAAAARRLK